MADNIQVTQGSGTTVATDDVGGVHHQKIKVTLGAAGAADLVLDSGQQASAASLPVVIASDQDFIKAEDAAHGSGDKGIMALCVRNDNCASLANTDGDYVPQSSTRYGGAHVVLAHDPDTPAGVATKTEDSAHGSGDVGIFALGVRNDSLTERSGTDGDYTPLATDKYGRVQIMTRTTIVPVTPTITAGAYAANDQVGELQTIANAVIANQQSGVLAAITVVDKAKQNAALTVLLFNAMPTLVSADNDPIDIADSQIGPTYMGHVNISTGDYATLANNSVACAECSVPIDCGATSFYALVFTTGTPTYAATSDLIFNYHILQD